MGLLFALFLLIVIPAVAYYELATTPGVKPLLPGLPQPGVKPSFSQKAAPVASGGDPSPAPQPIQAPASVAPTPVADGTGTRQV